MSEDLVKRLEMIEQSDMTLAQKQKAAISTLMQNASLSTKDPDMKGAYGEVGFCLLREVTKEITDGE